MPSSADRCAVVSGMSNSAFGYGHHVGEFNAPGPIALVENKEFPNQPTIHDRQHSETFQDCALGDFSCTEDNPFSISIPPRKSYDHVQDKELRKKLKNRESAQAARDRKKAKMMFLERQVSDLIKRNRFLETENMELRKILQLAESQPHWNKSQIGQTQNGTTFPLNQQNQPKDSMQCPTPQPHFFQQTQTSLQTVCTYSTNLAEITVPLPKGSTDDVDTISQDPGAGISAISIPRNVPAKNENFPAGDQVFRRDVLYLTDNGYAPEENYSGNSTPRGSNPYVSRCHPKGVRDIHTEDWMLSLTGEAPAGVDVIRAGAPISEPQNQIKDTSQNALLPPQIMPCDGLEYHWIGIPPISGEQFHRPCAPENANTVSEGNGSFGYGENSYCDSSGVESMSSPDMSAGSAVSSPDIVDRLSQDFFGEKPTFKVH